MRTSREIPALLVAFALAACSAKDADSNKAPPAPPPATGSAPGIPVSANPPPAAVAHSHDAKHGGHMLEIGEEEAHVEIVHEPALGKITAYVYDGEMKDVDAESPVANLASGVQVPFELPSGEGTKGHVWTAVHDAFKTDPIDGRLRIKIGTKTYQSPLEPEGHDHK